MPSQEFANGGEAGISGAIQFATVTEDNHVRAICRLFGSDLPNDCLCRKLMVHDVLLEAIHSEVPGSDMHAGDEGGGRLGNNENLDAQVAQFLNGLGH